METTAAAVIGMIPEGLYLMVSLALAASVLRLATKGTLVQDLKCTETLARVDVLCVDKTGTITQPEMAYFVSNMAPDNETMQALQTALQREDPRKAVQVLGFSSETKYSAVAYSREDCYVLGAPEFILGASGYVPYRSLAEEAMADGSRVLLFAACLPGPEGRGIADARPLAFVRLKNPVRETAKETFAYFHDQGVTVKVISGDNPVTVAAAANEAGIQGADKYVDASTLESYEDIQNACEEYNVFGRVKPNQKKLLVQALQENKHTVAMTGDGVNDVLALKEADCSVAMASGSEVAAQISDLVLMNSDFASMPSVVAEGRRVINNIERSASLYLVKNIFTFVLSLITLFFTLPYPYTPAQLSLVNALTIGIPSFILAMEPNENRISGRFMPNVIYRALPAALSDLILVVGVMLFYLAFHIKEDMLSTLCTGIMGIVGLLMVHQTSLPMNKLRKAMLVGLCIAFVVCYFFLPELFTLSALDKPSLLILVVLGLLAFSVMFVCRRGLRKAKARLDKGIFPHRKKR